VTQIPPRTRNEALRELDYLIRLNQRHRRLYGRITAGQRFLELIAGSFAVGAALCSPPAILAVAGAALALSGFAGIAFDPARRHARYELTLQRYSRLRAEAVGTPEMPLAELDRRMGRIEDPDYIEGLRLPSHNDMLRSHGLKDHLSPLTRWQRCVAALA